MKFTKLLKNGIVDENPVLVQVIGNCSFNLFEYSNIPNEKIYTR